MQKQEGKEPPEVEKCQSHKMNAQQDHVPRELKNLKLGKE